LKSISGISLESALQRNSTIKAISCSASSFWEIHNWAGCTWNQEILFRSI